MTWRLQCLMSLPQRPHRGFNLEFRLVFTIHQRSVQNYFWMSIVSILNYPFSPSNPPSRRSALQYFKSFQLQLQIITKSPRRAIFQPAAAQRDSPLTSSVLIDPAMLFWPDVAKCRPTPRFLIHRVSVSTFFSSVEGISTAVLIDSHSRQFFYVYPRRYYLTSPDCQLFLSMHIVGWGEKGKKPKFPRIVIAGFSSGRFSVFNHIWRRSLCFSARWIKAGASFGVIQLQHSGCNG